jgi:hypothetical protein
MSRKIIDLACVLLRQFHAMHIISSTGIRQIRRTRYHVSLSAVVGKSASVFHLCFVLGLF